MKHSLGKLRMFAAPHRSDQKDKSGTFPPAELAQASKDMQSIKNCYNSLLSAAAATANSAYEFSESLQEMGACLIEKTTLHGDEDSGRLLAMLGRVQFELQQLVDTYRSHIFLTITNPSESLLNELRTVEEMKKQCDEKRCTVEYMMAQQKKKGRTKSRKGDSASQQLERAREEYEDEANLCVFRFKSLKHCQSRSLLTQAARYHAAQMSFFKKGLKSLEAVDSHVKLIAQLQHIDYKSSVIEDDVEDDGSNGFNVKEGGELSFDYSSGAVSTSRNSMEAVEKIHVEKSFSSRVHRLISHSYVLPMPMEVGGPGSKHNNLWHSSPLEQTTPSELKEKKSSQLPPPVSDKMKRQAFSGPLTSSRKKPVVLSSPNASPPLGCSSPRISERHELPLPPPPPPGCRAVKSVGHSAPLVRNVEGSSSAAAAATNRMIPASPLPAPPPPLNFPQSFSIPSSSQRAMLMESPHVLRNVGDDVSSPPLRTAPMKPRTSLGAAIGSRSGPIRGRI